MVWLKFRDYPQYLQFNQCGWIIQLAKMRLNKPWVFWYTIIIQTDWQTHISQILPSTRRVLLSLSGQWWRHHPKHGDERIGWASNTIEPSNPPTADG
jgi:hypothetical protein